MSNNEYHFRSLLPDRKQWKLIWNDEFDGDALDETKWSYRTHMMHQRHRPFAATGAYLDGNSNVVLPLMKDGKNFCSPHLQTGSNFMDSPAEVYGSTKLSWPIGRIEEAKFMHKYGYYECRCKLPEQSGWSAAFWLQSPLIGSTMNPSKSGVELDIMETWERDGTVSHNHHWNGYGSQHVKAASGPRKLKKTATGFHVFGLEWTRDGYAYYIDGELSWRISGPVSDCEQFILISTECIGYRAGDTACADLENATLPDAFVVDYVRVFDEIAPLDVIEWRDELVRCYLYKCGDAFKASIWHYGDSQGLQLCLAADAPAGFQIPVDSSLAISDHALFLEFFHTDLAHVVDYLKRSSVVNTVPLLPSCVVRAWQGENGYFGQCTFKNDSSNKISFNCLLNGAGVSGQEHGLAIDPWAEQSALIPIEGDADTSNRIKVMLQSGHQSWSFDADFIGVPLICRTDGAFQNISKSIKADKIESRACFSVERNEDDLIVRVRVHDLTPSGEAGGRAYWEQDCVELFFDPEPEKMQFCSPTNYHEKVVRFFLLPYASKHEQLAVSSWNESVFDMRALSMDCEHSSDGYEIVFKVSIVHLGIASLSPKHPLGFDIIVNDANGAEKALTALSWNSSGDAHKNRLSFGRIQIT